MTGGKAAPRRARYIIGTDIGGTFTDVVGLDHTTGQCAALKLLTTPEAPERAVIFGIEAMLRKLGAAIEQVRTVAHATTLATNALIERKGAVVGMITTEGFRDVVEIGYEQMYDLYDISLPLPEPLVPRSRRRPLRERIGYDGSVMEPVCAASLDQAVAELVDLGVEAVAVCLLHSYANDSHEVQVASRIGELAPKLPVSCSAAILPEIGELGRFSTCVANAYVQPIVAGYLARLAERLRGLGHRGRLMVINSRGGSMTPDSAAQYPVRMLESGPAAGASAVSALAKSLGLPRVLSFDMGGTTAKICLVRDGEAQRTFEFEAARLARFRRKSGIPIRIPVVELIEIGAGGGSIARIDQLGLLTVGPDSAGSVPGPACYGRGGNQPTVTDAVLLLGYLNPDYFADGDVGLDVDAARAAMAPIGKALGRATEGAAAAIYGAVTEQMARAAELHAAEHGVDLRSYTLLAFGGAGPVHAAELARLIGIRTVVVPPVAGALSALGAASAPISFDFAASYKCALAKIDVDRVNAMLESMEAEGRELIARGERTGRILVRRSVDMRYLNQRYEVSVPLTNRRLSTGRLDRLEEAFRASYRERYGREIEGVAAEAVTWRVEVSAATVGTMEPFTATAPAHGGPAQSAWRRIVHGGAPIEAEVHRRSSLAKGRRLRGPAIVEDAGSTCVIPPGARARVDDMGNLVIEL
jgi:N-methylhydantoinase A/oxoprolinase/acetone carboxylase beta subunit